MCSLHLTHPSGAVGSLCGARGAVGGSVPCSRVSPQSWTLPPGARIRTHNLGLQVQRSIHSAKDRAKGTASGGKEREKGGRKINKKYPSHFMNTHKGFKKRVCLIFVLKIYNKQLINK